MNSWAGGDLQSFVVGVSSAASARVNALRAEADNQADLDAARVAELQDAELAAMLEEQLVFASAHPRLARKDKLPASGVGSKFRNRACCTALHSLPPDATSE